jgi:hypothetical protein
MATIWLIAKILLGILLLGTCLYGIFIIFVVIAVMPSDAYPLIVQKGAERVETDITVKSCGAKHKFLKIFRLGKFCVCGLIGQKLIVDKKIINGTRPHCFYKIRGKDRYILPDDFDIVTPSTKEA